MESQLRLMAILAVVFLGLFAVFVFWEPSEELDAEESAVIWDLSYDDIYEVEIVRDGDTIVLEKGDDGWVLESPVEYAANDSVVDEVLYALSEVSRGVPVLGEPDNFGVGDPTHALVTVTTTSDEELKLWVGQEAPIERRTYVRTASSGVVAVNVRLREPLLRRAFDFRDARLVDYEVGEVTAVTIEGPLGTLDITKDGERWWLAGFSRVDLDALDELLVGLLDLRLDAFLDEAMDNIAVPVFSVTIEATDNQMFWVGDETPVGTLVLLGNGAVGAIGGESLALLGQGPTDIGVTQAFPFNATEADRVEVTTPAGTVGYERSGNKWTRDGKDGQAFVNALQEARMVYRQAPVPAPDESWAMVTIMGDVTDTVVIGQVIEDNFRVAVDGAGGSPYLVRLSDIAGIVQYSEPASGDE
ncbi:MAG: DUF4340 domain-containing protein [Proteobacteria bacterium]|nr:DUF4340 domain-containing protein [Pseudomonadota bacterium]